MLWRLHALDDAPCACGVVYSERTSRAILVIAYGFIQSVTVFRSVTAQLTVISVWFYVSIFSSFQFVTFIISLGV